MSEWQPDEAFYSDDARMAEQIRDDDDRERELERRDRLTRDAGETPFTTMERK